MNSKIAKVGASIAILAVAAAGGSAIAGAAQEKQANAGSAGAGQTAAPPRGAPQPGQPPSRSGQMPPPGGPRGHKPEKPLTGDTAAKVKHAALDKVSGGTIVRVETDSDHGSPYEAHVRKSDGSEVVVYVNKSFEVTSVASMQHP
jgi:uncharacterized membrane protein YkoI